MEEGFYTHDGRLIEGIIEYSLGFIWLKFAFYLAIEVKTGKMLKE
jgi:hypothetical protein